MHPVLFRLPIKDFPVHTYGVLIVCGFILAMFVAWREARRHDPELGEEVLDFAFWALLGGMAGARIVFIIVNWEDYAQNPIKIIQFWEGGLVFYGAALGGTGAFFWFARRRGYAAKRTSFWPTSSSWACPWPTSSAGLAASPQAAAGARRCGT